MAETLLQLAELITNAAREIDAACKRKNATFPALDAPFDPASEEIRGDPQVLQAAAVAVAAAEQFVASAWIPGPLVVQTALSFHVSSAMRVATTFNVSEYLREAGPKGAHVSEICKGLSLPPQKLARVLRLLATRHIFREIAPDVFCNNRLSSLLDTGKSVAELRAVPEKKHENTRGLVALLEHFTEDMFKTSAFLSDALTDPAMAAADAPNAAAFNLAWKTDMDYWSWLDSPNNKKYLERFSIAMSATRQLTPEGEILNGFKWDKLPQHATIVDVGGGVGAVSLVLAKAYPDMKLVVQDRKKTVDEAHKFWEDNMPGAVASGRITLDVHDFFEEQPRRAPDVFLLRMILHDWADSYARKILRPLRAAAGANTALVIVDNVVPYACVDDSALTKTIPGAGAPPAPAPLLANMGVVNAHNYLADVQMLNVLNGQERTLAQFDALLRSAGWQLERVHREPGAMLAQIVAKPL
ncbi:O-methyltransferase [Auricularia subglabra TFB-10046 SS5]|nr:O-methyltransferase [Auricularia subglabra TFB-10046 SS5]